MQVLYLTFNTFGFGCVYKSEHKINVRCVVFNIYIATYNIVRLHHIQLNIINTL